MRAFLAAAETEGRWAWRGLARTPAFSLGVVLVLGIAIAGIVTVATAVHDLFLRPLPFSEPAELAHVSAYSRTMGFDVGFAPPMIAEVAEEQRVVDVAAYHPPTTLETSSGDEWRVAAVTHNLADLLGVAPIAGRRLVPADGEPGAAPVALIGEAAWRNRFGADPAAVGREIDLNDQRVSIVGVMPAAFSVPSVDTDLWRPLRYTPEELAPEAIGSFVGGHLVVRLAPGFSPAGLRDALTARYAADERLDTRQIRELMGVEVRVRGLRNSWTDAQREPLAVIGLASLLVLVTALFNIAGLWLARLLSRAHEHAIQAALGASGRRRLARTLFEFALLGVAGVGVALALTPFALGWLEDLGVLSSVRPLPVATGPATFVIALAVLAAGAVPVLLAAMAQQRRRRYDLLADLSSGGYGRARAGTRARHLFIVAQVALAMSLICAMGLLLRSWHGLLKEDLGFEPRNLLVARINASADHDAGADPRVAAALEELRGIPGVVRVSTTNVAPFAKSESLNNIPAPDREDGEVVVHTRWVGEGFFRTTGIPLQHGRDFAAGDEEDRGVIVDEHFASLHFPADGAVGEQIRMRWGPDSVLSLIVGVAGTAKYRAPNEQPERGTIYRFNAVPWGNTTAVIATLVPPGTLIDDVEAVLERALGPDRTGSVAAMQTLVRDTVRDREPQLVLLGLFGAETLVLAGVGLFSLLAWSVRARTAEFGLRQAIGARAADIRRQVLGEAARTLAAGLALGAVGAFVAGRMIAGRLYQVSPLDPLTLGGTALLLVLVVLAAGLWPAERAARVQPNEALHYE